MQKRIVILSDLVICAKCGDHLLFRANDSSFFHFPSMKPPYCDVVGSAFPESQLNDALWQYLSEYMVLSEEQRQSIVRLALARAGSTMSLDPEQARERLGGVVQMMRDHASKDAREVNVMLRAIFEKIRVDPDGRMTYVPRAWCASLFTTPTD